MCLITKQTEPFIATEDMTVYKVVRLDRTPINYGGITYRDGDIITADIERSNRPKAHDPIVSEHYNIDLGAYTLIPQLERNNLYAYGPGIHVYMSKERANALYIPVLLECIIPAGTKYYIDETGLGVTEKLIVVGEVRG